MPEKGPRQSSVRAEASQYRYQTPIQKVRRFADQTAHYRDIGPLATDALAKFAVCNYRIENIARNFRGTNVDKVFYPSYVDDKGVQLGMKVRRTFYIRMISILSATAFNIYNQYLSGDEQARAAAKDVRTFVNDLFAPKA